MNYQVLKRSAHALLLISTLTLSGCVTMMGSSGAIEEHAKAVPQLLFCDGYKPILWSASDTDETIKQAKVANALYLEKCK